MGTVKIEVAKFLSDLTELELNFYQFQSLKRTFNGWVLSLDEVEFRDLMVDFTLYKGKGNELPPKYTILEFIDKGILTFETEEFTEDLQIKADHLKKISMVKDGYMTYEVADNDEDWKFTITEYGKKAIADVEARKSQK